LSAERPGDEESPAWEALAAQFSKYHELFEEPHHRRAADDSLTTKNRKHLGLFPVSNLSTVTSDIYGWFLTGHPLTVSVCIAFYYNDPTAQGDANAR
jgi:hypothetical protein